MYHKAMQWIAGFHQNIMGQMMTLLATEINVSIKLLEKDALQQWDW